jgi:hypothetical protein
MSCRGPMATRQQQARRLTVIAELFLLDLFV